MWRLIFIYSILIASCHSSRSITVPARPRNALGGEAFYKKIIPLSREERETLAAKEILSGNIPSFLRHFVPVTVDFTDSLGTKHEAVFWVAPDYLSMGSDKDFARIPLTPMTAQRIADTFHCFLPTPQMVDAIYRQAVVKLEPVPLYQYRDSALIFWHHQLIIEGQRKGRRGLIAGIKKDVVISGKLRRDPRPHRVAIYGWHKPDGIPIQPLYTGHVDWYVDYSHGIRLVYRKLRVDGRWMDYQAVFQNPMFKGLLCDEPDCDFFNYAY